MHLQAIVNANLGKNPDFLSSLIIFPLFCNLSKTDKLGIHEKMSFKLRSFMNIYCTKAKIFPLKFLANPLTECGHLLTYLPIIRLGYKIVRNYFHVVFLYFKLSWNSLSFHCPFLKCSYSMTGKKRFVLSALHRKIGVQL